MWKVLESGDDSIFSCSWLVNKQWYEQRVLLILTLVPSSMDDILILFVFDHFIEL